MTLVYNLMIADYILYSVLTAVKQMQLNRWGGGGEIVLARKCLRGGRLREMESLVKDDLFIVCMLTVLFIVCMLKNTIHLYSE